MNRLFLVLVVALVAVWHPEAAADLAAKSQVESSLRLAGSIDIAADGSVEDIALERVEKVPQAVLKFARDAALRWRFEPIRNAEGEAIAVSSPVRMLLVAREVTGGDFELRIESVSFDRHIPNNPASLVYEHAPPPKYPNKPRKAWVQGTVYVVVKVGRDGRVEDLGVRQVNLQAMARESEMRRWREAFAAASVQAIREWRFRVPTEGISVDLDRWFVIIPIAFRLQGDGIRVSDSPWEAYVRGPREALPWDDVVGSERVAQMESLAPGGVYMAHSDGPRLLTPLGER